MKYKNKTERGDNLANIFKRITDNLKQRSISNTSDKNMKVALVNSGYYDDLLGYTPLSKNPEVAMAVDKIADLTSNMTIHLMENTDKGDKRVRNQLSRKIDIEPYQNMTRKSWIYKIVADLLLHGDGNSLVHIGIDRKTGLIGDLTPLDMSQVSYDFDKKNKLIVNYGGQNISQDNLIHFTLKPSPHNPSIGTGYRTTLRYLVENLTQAAVTKRKFMAGDYMPSLIVKVDALSEELASEEGRETVKSKYLKSSKSGEPWVLPAELFEVEQVRPLTLNDIAINENVELDKRTVAGIFDMPAFMLGVGEFDKDEYNNFIQTRIMSIATIISQTLTRDILYSENMYFRLNPRSLYAYSMPDLVNAGTLMVDRNAMRRNELRDWVGLDPDEEMEELIILENYVPHDKLGDQEKLKGGE